MADALITPDLTPDEALRIFKAACNKGPDVLFITESWFAAFERRLRARLASPIGPVAAAALEDALRKRRSLETVLEFLEHQPMTWDEHALWRAAEDEHARLARAEQGFFPWEDVEASERRTDHRPERDVADLMPGAQACHKCARPGADLKWVYFSSPDWTWEHLCGRAGWLSICEPCHLQVEFFLEVMN